jgi:hypothetical protein
VNIIEKHKVLVLLPMRQATRAVFSIFKPLGIKSTSDRPKVPVHSLDIPNNIRDYTVVCTKRHPYIRFKSIIKWSQNIYSNYYDALEGNFSIMDDYFTILNYYNKKNINYFIDTESIYEDIIKIPLVEKNLNNSLFKEQLLGLSLDNIYKTPDKELTKFVLPKEIKDIIYNRYKEYFITFNYDKNLEI